MLHSKIDLNLFLILSTIHEQGTITAAAQKLHLTQPAVSHALTRLRSKFNDPLFVRHGRKMLPTPLCQSLLPDVQQALQLLQSSLDSKPSFDIGKYPRQFNLGLRDILESLFFPELVTDLQTHTPNITLSSRQILRDELQPALSQGQLDIVIDVLMPTHKDIRSTLIRNEPFSLICRQGHPILQQLTLDSYQNAQHALVSLKGFSVDAVDMALAKLGVSRNIAFRCEHYFAAMSVICRCDMIMTMPNTYAQLLKDKMPIVVSPLPFEVPPLPVHMYWHQHADQDPVNLWLRNKFIDLAAKL
ncbi:LysR family transcriptional regulator [Shewanella maritima]|uniref:LysR family transcriptional regulator n=1 Tax=Shewanella maritima TaxID=2520507 RepID=UPI00373537AB